MLVSRPVNFDDPQVAVSRSKLRELQHSVDLLERGYEKLRSRTLTHDAQIKMRDIAIEDMYADLELLFRFLKVLEIRGKEINSGVYLSSDVLQQASRLISHLSNTYPEFKTLT